LKIDSVEFVRSAAGPGDLPDAALPELSMVGRSNVGKSSLINALMRRQVARTSAAPGKTRLINLYKVTTARTGPFYLVDLPGFGYARKEGHAEFERLAAMYFRRQGDVPVGVLLALDARHPGMENDLATLQWLRQRGFGPAEPGALLLIVVTKIDKVSRNARAKALDRFERLCEQPVLAVSAATGEGLEDLWKPMISWVASQATNRTPRPRP